MFARKGCSNEIRIMGGHIIFPNGKKYWHDFTTDDFEIMDRPHISLSKNFSLFTEPHVSTQEGKISLKQKNKKHTLVSDSTHSFIYFLSLSS